METTDMIYAAVKLCFLLFPVGLFAFILMGKDTQEEEDYKRKQKEKCGGGGCC